MHLARLALDHVVELLAVQSDDVGARATETGGEARSIASEVAQVVKGAMLCDTTVVEDNDMVGEGQEPGIMGDEDGSWRRVSEKAFGA